MESDIGIGIISPRSQLKKDRIDHIIFLVLTCVLALVTLKGFTFTDDESVADWFGLGYSYDHAIPLYLTIPAAVLFIALAVVFLVRRKPVMRKRELILTSIFIVLCLYRISTYLIFPTGEMTFVVDDPYSSQILELTYSDYLITDRVSECIAEVCFLFYFYLAFTFFIDIKHGDKIVTEVVYHLFSLVAIVMTIYSIICERDGLINNLYDFIGRPGYGFVDVTSLTSHRNVFGLFITLGVISEISVIFLRPNLISVLIAGYLTFFSVMIHSRTTICICILLSLLTAILFVCFYTKKHPIISGVFMFLLLSVIVLIILVFTVYSDSEFTTNLSDIIRRYFDTTSLGNRGYHIKTSLALLFSNSFALWLGFGRVPFTSIYHQYLLTIDYEVNTVTSHCGFLEPFFYQGAIMGVLQLLCYLGILAMIIYLFTSKQKDNAFGLLLTYLGLGIHSAVESRALFIFDSTSVLFMLILLLPVLEDCSYYSANKTAIISDRRLAVLSNDL